jgi:ribosomal protein L1
LVVSLNNALEGNQANMPVTKRGEKKVRTTVSLPERLYEEARSVVDAKATPAASINGLFVSAIRAYVKLIQRKQIDAKFAGMSEDAEYQKEAGRISEEFGPADWEAFERAEKDAQ